MSKCDLYMVFDREDPTYQIGEEVVGAVRISVNKDSACKRIFLRKEWRTHGRGNRDHGGREEIDLTAGEQVHLRAGEEKNLAFRFPVPNGPVSYHGHYLNVDWYARVQVDIPWAADPKVEKEFLVVPGPEPGSVEQGDVRSKGVDLTTANLSAAKGCFALFGLVFVLAGLSTMGVGLFMIPTEGGWVGKAVFAGIGMLFTLVGLGIGWFAMRNKLARRKLGEVTVETEPRDVRPGQTLVTTVRCAPQVGTRLESISATLRGNEVAVSGSGTNRSTHTHEIQQDRQEQTWPRTPCTGQPLQVSFSHTVSEDAPATFMADDNQVFWTLVVQIKLKGWPDWANTFPVTVRP